MPWVITRLCIDCLDTACVSVCPVDCIYEYVGEDGRNFPNQLYIHPDECIDCGACEPECPWQAIYEESAVPELFNKDVALNAMTGEMPDQFRVKKYEEKPDPTPEQIEVNHHKWERRADSSVHNRSVKEHGQKFAHEKSDLRALGSACEKAGPK